MTADVSSMAGLPPVEATTRTLWMMVALYVLFSPNSCVALHSLFSRFACARRHVAGFSAIRFGLLPRSTLEGLGAYVATIGLPSVLFDTIAHLSFDSVNWYVVFAVVSAKLLLVLLSISLAWLTTRRADGTGFAYTLGGVNALLSTMSDDMGIGMPIFAALFSAGPGVCRTHLFYSPLSLNATRACLSAQSTSPSSSTSSSSPPYNPPLSTQSSSSSSASAEPMQRSNEASSGVRVLILTLLTAAEARETGAEAAKAARLRAGMAERAAAARAARVEAEYSSRSNRRRYRLCYWRSSKASVRTCWSSLSAWHPYGTSQRSARRYRGGWACPYRLPVRASSRSF